MLPDIELYRKATITQTAWSWHRSRHTDQRNGIQNQQ